MRISYNVMKNMQLEDKDEEARREPNRKPERPVADEANENTGGKK